LLPIFLPMVQKFMAFAFGSSDAPITLAAFHTFFNLANVILLIGFVPFLVKAAIWSVKGVDEDEDEFKLKFIGTSSLTPELATVELQKETAHFGEVMSRMSTYAKDLINATEPKKIKKLHKKIKKYEKISDRMEVEITEFITNLSTREITPKTSMRLRSIINVCNDLERVGDVYYQISKTIEVKNEEKSYFTPAQRNNLNEMSDKLDHAFNIMLENLNEPSYDNVDIIKAADQEKEINKYRNKLRDEHLDNLGKEDYNVKSAMIYNNIFHALERVGDHVINVSEAVVGQI